MNDNTWDELVTRIDEMYTIDDSTRVVEKLEDNPKLSKTIQRIDFEKDNVKYRIENIESPKINDKKTFYHHKGAANRVEYEYDPEETSKKVIFTKCSPTGITTKFLPKK
jgi:hypothetical protein